MNLEVASVTMLIAASVPCTRLPGRQICQCERVCIGRSSQSYKGCDGRYSGAPSLNG
jgi:hypothetical protein